MKLDDGNTGLEGGGSNGPGMKQAIDADLVTGFLLLQRQIDDHPFEATDFKCQDELDDAGQFSMRFRRQVYSGRYFATAIPMVEAWAERNRREADVAVSTGGCVVYLKLLQPNQPSRFSFPIV